MTRIPTYDRNGKPNGWLLPIWRTEDDPVHVHTGQVYVTAVALGCSKGPHLHRIRMGRFTCISGDVRIVTRVDGQYASVEIGETKGYRTITVPPGVPNEIVNIGEKEALVINMPFPAWNKNEPDDWPVENWEPPCSPAAN